MFNSNFGLRQMTACLLLLCFGVTSLAAVPLPDIPKDWPKWLQKAMKAEARKKRDRSLELTEDNIELRIGGKSELHPGSSDVAWIVMVEFGPESPAVCNVYRQRVDLGRAMLIGQDNVFKVTTDNAQEGKLDSKAVYYLDSGFYDDVPYLAIDWFYAYTSMSGEKVAGLSKVRAGERNGVAVVCMHDEIGYRKTFGRMFQNLMMNSDFGPSAIDYAYREGIVLTIDDKPVGFQTTSYAIDGDGDTAIVTRAVSAFNTDPSTLMMSDSVEYEYSTPDGNLINAISQSYENNTLQVDLALTVVDGAWQVKGTYRGKEISLPIEGGPLLSAQGKIQLTADLIASDTDDEATVPMWSAQVDPSTMTDLTLKVDERRAGANAMTLISDPLVIKETVDDDGTTSAATVSIGPVDMVFTRVFAEGKVP